MKTLIIILIFLICIILFCYLPGSKRKCVDFSWVKTQKIAHRGYYHPNAFIYENTASAFKKAIEYKMNIETDLQLSKDGKVIVYHDEDLKRLFDINKKISELTLSELKELSYPYGDDKILELSELLLLVNNKVGLILELKSFDPKQDQLLCDKVMEILCQYQGPYVIQSFNPMVLRYFKKHYPLVARGQLYMKFNLKEEIKKGEGFKNFMSVVGKMFYNIKCTHFLSRPHFISQDYQSYSWINKVLKVFLPLIVYTIDDPSQYQKFLKQADNIIFEHLTFDKYGRVRKNIS